MSQPIYKCFQISWKEEWYQLSPDEQNAMLAKLSQKLEEVGGKSIVICQSGWANEGVQFWGVEVFPNIEAVQKLNHYHAEIGWFRYTDSTSLLGTELQPPA